MTPTIKGCVLSYLVPPPLPAPVIVTKDFGGFVSEYQARTEEYRKENREVRVHECHSACTLALSLPNVCVYPNSIFKFHQAYNMHDHITDSGVSAELFNAYPDAVRARLGTLTREFKILKGSELIELGIKDCNEPRIMVASVGKTVQRPVDPEISLSGMMHSVASVLPGIGGGEPASARINRSRSPRASRRGPPPPRSSSRLSLCRRRGRKNSAGAAKRRVGTRHSPKERQPTSRCRRIARPLSRSPIRSVCLSSRGRRSWRAPRQFCRARPSSRSPRSMSAERLNAKAAPASGPRYSRRICKCRRANRA